MFDLIRSERRQVAAKLRAEGEAQYVTITSQADRMRDTILAQAEAEAQRIRGNAEAEATRMLNEAHARDPKFFEFLRTLDSYRSILDGQTTVVLVVVESLAQALVAGALDWSGPRNLRPSRLAIREGGRSAMKKTLAILLIVARIWPPRWSRRRAGAWSPPARSWWSAGSAGWSNRRWGPGLHWRLPLGIDRLDRVRSDAVRQLTIGLAGTAGSDLEPSAGEVMTGDLNLLRFQATVQYRVARPVDYRSARRAGRAAARDVGRGERLTRAGGSRRRCGLALRSPGHRPRCRARPSEPRPTAISWASTILGVSLTDARPPTEVEADFAAAQSAESERDRRINEAKSYDETTATAARSTAQAKLEAAHAAAERRILTAQAEAQRFIVLLAEAERSRSLTMRRLYIESMQALLTG